MITEIQNILQNAPVEQMLACTAQVPLTVAMGTAIDGLISAMCLVRGLCVFTCMCMWRTEGSATLHLFFFFKQNKPK